MIFRPELAAQVLRGTKTVTRRVPSTNPRSPWYRGGCRLVPGRDYAVCPGRGRHAVCRVVVQRVVLEPLGYLSADGAAREGFATPKAFEAAWRGMHGRYNPRQLVWRVEFELVGGNPRKRMPVAPRAPAGQARRLWPGETYGRPGTGLQRPVQALAWELRTEWARRRPVRLVLSARCDAVLLNEAGERVLEGRLSHVSATDAFCVCGGHHVPLDEVQVLVRPHHTQAAPSRTVYDQPPPLAVP